MNDKADVSFVNAHAKGNCGTDDADPILDPMVLHFLPDNDNLFYKTLTNQVEQICMYIFLVQTGQTDQSKTIIWGNH